MSTKKTSQAGLATFSRRMEKMPETCLKRDRAPVTSAEKEIAAWAAVFHELKIRGIDLHQKAKNADVERAIRAWADASMDMRDELRGIS